MVKKVKRIYRSKTNKVIAGVCGGLGDYFGVDPVLFRLLWLLLLFGYGFGVFAYLVAWLIIPLKK